MGKTRFDIRFGVLTAAMLAVLVLQGAGALSGLNEWMDSHIPLLDTPLINVLTALGGDLSLISVAALSLAIDWKRGGKPSLSTVAFVLAAVVGIVAVGALKFLFAEPRPRAYGSGVGAYAFPSGHTFRAAVIAAYVSDRWKRLAPLAWCYAVVIALTRLLLHYHWFSDVLFSLLFAPWLYLLLKSLLGGRLG